MKKRIVLGFLFMFIFSFGSKTVVHAQNTSQLYNLSASSYAEFHASEIKLYTTDSYDGYLPFENERVNVNVIAVSTPNNSSVEAYQTFNDLSSSLINVYNSVYDAAFENATRLSSATAHYNCHSYAWYSQDTETNNYWMNDPAEFYGDNSYVEVDTPREGDIICYFNIYGKNLHSGIVSKVNPGTANNICEGSNLVDVTSKWGAAGLYEHKGDECPYTSYSPSYAEATAWEKANYYASEVRYFRPNTNASYTLSNTSSQVSETVTVTSSNDNTNNYEMYELNVDTSKNYTFEIAAYSPLNVRLYDEHMQLVQYTAINPSSGRICINQYLSKGRYYLRVAFNDSSKTGTINVSFGNNSHTHLYLWEYYTNSSHIETCSCGLTGTVTRPHIVNSSDLNNRYVECLECHYLLDMSVDEAISQMSLGDITMYSVNGSYILASGIIVLVDEDIDAYSNGTLVFYVQEYLPVTQ